MKLNVNTIDELISSSNNPELFQELYDILKAQIKEEGTIFKTNSEMTMIGFKYIDYKNSNYDGKWPLISIAPQKNNISVYIFALEGDEYLVEKYGQEFGKSNIGKSCIRVRKLSSTRREKLKYIIDKALKNIN